MDNIVSTGISAGHLPAGMPPRYVPHDKFVPRHPPQEQQPKREYIFPSINHQQQHTQ